MTKQIIVGIVVILLGAAGAYGYISKSSPAEEPNSEPVAEFCGEHQIAESACPWCDPSLVTAKGECIEHGVAEALCVKCQPALIAGFKTEGDWCASHETPESQCAICLGEGGHGGDNSQN